MAETLKIPKQVVDSDWKDDVDVDYAIYGDTEKKESEYVSQNGVDEKNKIMSISRIKEQRIGQKVGHIAIFKPGDKLAA